MIRVRVVSPDDLPGRSVRLRDLDEVVASYCNISLETFDHGGAGPQRGARPRGNLHAVLPGAGAAVAPDLHRTANLSFGVSG